MATQRFLVLVIAVLAAAMISTSEAQGDEVEVYDGIETEFIFKWHGGFIGNIEIPIHENIDGWNMTITFPKNIFNFEICPAEVVDIVDKRVFHLTNKPWNAKLHEDDTLEMWFNAKTWRKIRGLVGIIHFEGRIAPDENETETTGSPPTDEPSSSAMGFDNGLTCEPGILNQNNVTCGARFIPISGSGRPGPYVGEIRLPVDFADTEATVIDMTTNYRILFLTLESTFNHRLELDSGTVMPITGIITTKGQREHIFNLDMGEDDEFENVGHGMLIIQIRFGLAEDANNGEIPVFFPYIEGTTECPCTRLKLTA